MRAYHRVAGAGAAYFGYQFDADDRAATYAMREAFCDDPPCHAGESEVTLFDVADTARRCTFRVELATGRVADGEEVPETWRAIVDELLRNGAVRRLLVRHRQIVRAAGLAEWKDGPPVAAEEGCYAFCEFDVNGEEYPMPFELDGAEWSAIDQYCVQRSCDCEEAVLTFYEEVPGQRALDPAFSLRLDLRTGEAREADEETPLTPFMQRVLQRFQDELVSWQHDLGLRRRLMRRIAKRRLTDATAPVRVGVKVGRNDPCPCGSGRKFKKCCLAAS